MKTNLAAVGHRAQRTWPSVRVTLAALLFPPDYSGPGLRFQRYAPGLARRGISLDVCAVGLRPDEPPTCQLGGTASVSESVDEIPVERLQIDPAWSNRRIHYRYARSLAHFVRDRSPKVVQLLQLSPWGLPGLMSLRRGGVPTVYTQTMMPDEAMSRRVRGAHWRYPFALVDRLVVSSTAMLDATRALGVETPAHVIPNGVDLTRFHPVDRESRDRIRARLDLPVERPLVLFVGGFLSRRKGLDVLADAWPRIEAEHPDAHLVLVGPDISSFDAQGPQVAFIEGIQERLAPAMDRGHITFAGSVTNVEEYFQAADVFVFPSRKEGMPNVVPEACACGTPMVLTAFEGLSPELGRPGVTFELVDRTAQAIGERVIDLLRDPGRRAVLARHARAWVEQHMDVQRSLDAYAELYGTLAASSKG